MIDGFRYNDLVLQTVDNFIAVNSIKSFADGSYNSLWKYPVSDDLSKMVLELVGILTWENEILYLREGSFF